MIDFTFCTAQSTSDSHFDTNNFTRPWNISERNHHKILFKVQLLITLACSNMFYHIHVNMYAWGVSVVWVSFLSSYELRKLDKYDYLTT